MRAKPILSLTLLAAALALAGHGSLGRLGQDDVAVVARSAAVGADRAHVRHATKTWVRSPRASRIRRSIARTASRTRACCRGRASRSNVCPTATPSSRSPRASSVVEPYLDLLVEVNWASGRVVRAYTFLLDPPGMPRRAGDRTRDARRVPARGAARRRLPPRRDRRAGAGRRRCGRSGGGASGNSYTRPARRHAVADRRRIQAAGRDARADAGRALQQQSDRVRRQHESPARRRDPQHSERRGKPRRRAPAEASEDRAPAGLRLAQLSGQGRGRSAAVRRRAALASRAERSARRSKKRSPPRRRVAISSRCRRKRARARRAPRQKKSCRATRR